MTTHFQPVSDAKSSDYWATADFTGCPRPPVLDEDVRMLSEWRSRRWAHKNYTLALSLSNNDILYAYRRIWGRDPLRFLPGDPLAPLVQEWHGYDYAISGTELELISYHLCGWRLGGQKEPPVKRIVCEIKELHRYARHAEEV